MILTDVLIQNIWNEYNNAPESISKREKDLLDTVEDNRRKAVRANGLAKHADLERIKHAAEYRKQIRSIRKELKEAAG